MGSGRLLLAAVLLSSSVGLPASQPAPSASQQAEIAARERVLKQIEAGLHPQTGVVAIPGGHASLNLGDRYYFLPAAEAKRVLSEGWGNPPGAVAGVLGMVLPKGVHFYDETWGAVIEYQDTGHIDDKDAAGQDYETVLGDLKAGEEESNKAAREAGYSGGTTIGWAQAPTYDPVTRTLIWARNIKFDNAAENTLNYDVRTLSRTGTLSLNMVDTMGRIGTVREAARGLGRTINFDSGQRYADFDSKTDKLADFGLAGLVAGGVGLAVAKKIGILGILLLFLKKGLVVVLIAAAAGWKWIKRKIGGGADEVEQDYGTEEPLAEADVTEVPEPEAAPPSENQPV